MELKIQPFSKNNHPKTGLLIKSASPSVWFQEMEILGIDLNYVRSFPIPSHEPNVVYGCFLVFHDTAPNEIGRNSYFQCFDNKLFIPENTTFYPKINPEDWQNIDAEFIIMHPDFGLVKLNDEMDWLSIIQHPEQSVSNIIKPSKGVKIPQRIESYTVDIDDEKILEALQKPQTEEEWMKNLPFDLKKVLAGNKKEIEKYLKYIEKYHDRAVELGVPLDVTGTGRGDGWGKFSFMEKTWFGKLFAGNNSGEKSRFGGKYAWVFWTFLIIISLVRFLSVYVNRDESKPVSENVSSGKVEAPDKSIMSPVVAYKSGVTDIDMKIDSMYGRKRRDLMKEHMNASLNFSKPNEKSYEEYLKNGGRPLGEIQNDIFKLNDKTDATTDSLKRVYRKKIVTYLAQNEERFKKNIKDSLTKKGSGKPADEGIVKNVLKKKQILVEDSLGRLYGTKEYPQVPPPVAASNAEKADSDEENTVSYSEIIWLIIFMTGAVGLYSFVIKKRSLNLGGENVPAGIKVFLMILLLGMLAYIFYPLIEMFGYNWFVWILIIGIVLLLYRLFSEDKTILKSDKDE